MSSTKSMIVSQLGTRKQVRDARRSASDGGLPAGDEETTLKQNGLTASPAADGLAAPGRR
jgi:hypothetical protein